MELSKVASGGEQSRVKLALKAALGKHITLSCQVFDEIDTGISGATAEKVGNLMSELAKNQQIITITHLPQVAAKAKYHFLVEKIVQDGKTKTQLYSLDHEARVEEIAKMLSGNQVTETAIAHAKQLMN